MLSIPSFLPMLIAATAFEYRFSLVTRNSKHFYPFGLGVMSRGLCRVGHCLATTKSRSRRCEGLEVQNYWQGAEVEHLALSVKRQPPIKVRYFDSLQETVYTGGFCIH
jgi:hypothetical protein